MMKYVCEPVFIEDILYWVIFEVKTEQVIQLFLFEDDAREYLSFLEVGGAFAGYTPGFMLRETQLRREPVNEAFSRTFS